MERVRPALIASAEYVARDPVFVVENERREPIAWYGFRARGDDIFLEDMWAHPAQIGNGLGRLMWEHAIATARAEGYRSFLIEADPNAEPFYLHCGARRIGELVSEATGRVVPLLYVEVEAAAL